MTAGARVFWIIALCFLLAGCSRSYHPYSTIETDQDAMTQGGDSPEPGDELRMTMRDGRIIKGDFVEFRQQSVILRGARLENSAADTYSEIEVSAPEREDGETGFPLSDVLMLEKYNSNTAGNLVLGAAFVAVVYGLVYAGQHTLDDFNLDLEQ